jgi:hypothetical protein
VGFRRLSDVEYANTVSDLLGIALPAGAGEIRTNGEPPLNGTFDNVVNAPSLTSLTYQAYFNSAVAIADAAFADATARARILTCAPASDTDTSCADKIIRAFGLRAWRRPLEDGEVTALAALARTAADAGEDLAGQMKRVVTALLASETFLYRIELDPAGDPLRAHPLTPYEVATRLSYLLWSSMPDETLFQLAGTGELARPEVVTAQAMRLAADARGDAFVRNFAGQWLDFRGLDARAAAPGALPGLTVPLARAMQEEARLFVTELLQKDLDLTGLLTADVNFVDDALAEIYGLPAPGAQDRLTRVQPTGDARKGYLGLAAFLTSTSQTSASSPARRGSKILRDLLCVDLGTPLPYSTTDFISPRARLAYIATLKGCGDCHLAIDSVGLGLENFDSLGRFRAKYGAADFLDIDPTGQLPDGTPFRGVSELADLLANDPRFLDCASRKVLSYALGRATAAADEPALGRLRASWLAGSHTLRGLLGAIVASDAFRFRRGETP